MAGKNTLASLKPFNAVIFDMDGVITDSEPLHAQHLDQFLIKLGVPNPQTHKLQSTLKGKNTRDTWAILLKKFELDHDLDVVIPEVRQSYINYLESVEKLPEIPGAVALIKQLYTLDYPLALATAANSKRAELFLTTLKIKPYFSAIVSGDDIKHSKPDPEAFLLAATRLNIAPEECVVIEDSSNGVQAAKTADMQCIAYGGSDHNTDNLSQADLIVKDFSLLTNFLKAGKQLI